MSVQSAFFTSRWVEVPDWVREDPAGGLPQGFRAAGVAEDHVIASKFAGY